MKLSKHWVLLGAAVAAFAAWGLFWAWTSARSTAAPAAWTAELRAAGWRAEAGEARVGGFPSRLDRTIDGLELSPPGGDWTWRAPSLLTRTLTYRPDYLELRALEGGQLHSEWGPARLDMATARASAVWEEGVLARASLRAEEVRLARASSPSTSAPPEDPALSAAALELHLRPAPDGDAAARRAYLKFEDARPRGASAGGAITLDGMMRFDAPWTGDLAAQGAPSVVEIADGAASLFSATAALSGRLERGTVGWSGRLTLTVENAAAALDGLRTAGWISSAVAATLQGQVDAQGRLEGALIVEKERLAFAPRRRPADRIALP